jgi:hypothetical protein
VRTNPGSIDAEKKDAMRDCPCPMGQTGPCGSKTRIYVTKKEQAVGVHKNCVRVHHADLTETDRQTDSFMRTTGKNVCADGQKLRRRPNIGAVGVAPSHGSPVNGPSGQKCRRRSRS